MLYKNLTLDPFQEEAIRYIEKGFSLLISAPTGSGKTLIAEYAIERAVEKNRGIIYTAPIKALSNQKYRDFRKNFKEKAGILTGDVSINPEAKILIMTTEIFRNLILIDSEKLKNREWVIFDEIHYLDDMERGTVWEEALMLLPPHLKIIALSATVPNIEEIASWLKSIHKNPLKVIKEEKRPVPLKFYFQINNKFFLSFKSLKNSHLLFKDYNQLKKKSYRRVPGSQKNTLSKLFNFLSSQNLLPCIYFSFSRFRTEILAQEISSFNFLNTQETKEITSLYLSFLKKFELEGEKTSEYLYSLIKKGVAFHHAGLLPTLKEVIERLFTSRLLKVIFTTETFALGINMPARTVIFDSLRKYYGSSIKNLKTRDFYQMAGRAGRRGIDKKGYVFIKINPSRITEKELQRIIYGKSERILSQLRSNYATVLNLYRDMKEKIYQIYPLSFHFFQARKEKKEEALQLLRRKLALLKELNYITSNQNLSWKGELASRIYSYELAIGEFYESHYLESCSLKELAILITALVYEPRKNEKKPKPSKYIKKIIEKAEAILKTVYRLERRFKIYPRSKKLYFHMGEIALLWFEGIRFSQLQRFTHIDEGELIRYFRMAIQIFRELLSFEGFSEDFKDRIRQILSRINRDEVDAEKQLRQEI